MQQMLNKIFRLKNRGGGKMKKSWKESKGKDRIGLCFSKDLNRLLLIMIITVTKGDNNDRRC